MRQSLPQQSPPKDIENVEPLSKLENEKLPILTSQHAASQWSVLHLVGAGLMLIAVVASALQQEVIQSAERGGTLDKVSLTIWFNHTCLFIVGFPASCMLHFVRTRSVSLVCMWRFFLEKQGWSTFQALMYIFMLAFLFLLPNLAWAATLKSISVTLVTAANKFDSAFILIFSSLLTAQAPPRVQVLSVMACILGVIFIAIGQRSEGSSIMGHTSIGECFAVLVSPCLSAVYFMIFNYLTRGCRSEPECICILIGVIGLFNFLFMWPVLPISFIAHLDGASLQKVFNAKGMQSMVLNAVLATTVNFTQMPALALTSPLFVSLAMIMLLPVSLIIDAGILHHTTPNSWLICGSVISIIGFSCSSLAEASGRPFAIVSRRLAVCFKIR